MKKFISSEKKTKIIDQENNKIEVASDPRGKEKSREEVY